MNAEQLREERLRLRLTQEELATLLGVHQRTISEWERGAVTIRHQVILERAMHDVAREIGRGPGLRTASGEPYDPAKLAEVIRNLAQDDWPQEEQEASLRELMDALGVEPKEML